MASPASARITARDRDLLAAIRCSPLTVRQLRKWSVTFAAPFTSERRLQERLRILCGAGLLRRFRYATEEFSAPSYWTLAPEGRALLQGADGPLPGPGACGPVGIARQQHTRCLADFIVHTAVGAHEAGILLTDFHRENTLALAVGEQRLYPDCALTLRVPGRPPLQFYVELDNGTEPMTSPRDRDSWEKKLRFYEDLRDSSAARFRVLALVTRSLERLEHIVALARQLTRNLQRSLCYGVCLSDYLAETDPLRAACFLDHRGRRVALVRWPREPLSPTARSALAALVKVGEC